MYNSTKWRIYAHFAVRRWRRRLNGNNKSILQQMNTLHVCCCCHSRAISSSTAQIVAECNPPFCVCATPMALKWKWNCDCQLSSEWFFFGGQTHETTMWVKYPFTLSNECCVCVCVKLFCYLQLKICCASFSFAWRRVEPASTAASAGITNNAELWRNAVHECLPWNLHTLAERTYTHIIQKYNVQCTFLNSRCSFNIISWQWTSTGIHL